MTRRVVEDPGEFRRVLGHLPTGVVVVTAFDADEPLALVVGSFTSVSLDPPLVGFFPGRSSTTWPRLHGVGAFTANVLGEHQGDLCRAIGAPGADRFASVDWSVGPSGRPQLGGAIAQIDCELETVTEAGDHWFVLAAVTDLRTAGERGPLVFFRGGYHRLEA